MGTYSDNELRKLSVNFLICCYFGQSGNLGKAAIDRAYVDMASHTLKGIKEKERFKLRYDASAYICDRIKDFNSSFGEWHEKTIMELKKIYEPNMSEGQAQKWLNMTIKYLFVFKTLLGVDDGRLKDFKKFLTSTAYTDYKVSIDSYVLDGSKISGLPEFKKEKWSKFDERLYANADAILEDENHDFIWELENWEDFAKGKKPDSGSYAEYYDNQEKQRY